MRIRGGSAARKRKPIEAAVASLLHMSNSSNDCSNKRRKIDEGASSSRTLHSDEQQQQHDQQYPMVMDDDTMLVTAASSGPTSPVPHEELLDWMGIVQEEDPLLSRMKEALWALADNHVNEEAKEWEVPAAVFQVLSPDYEFVADAALKCWSDFDDDSQPVVPDHWFSYDTGTTGTGAFLQQGREDDDDLDILQLLRSNPAAISSDKGQLQEQQQQPAENKCADAKKEETIQHDAGSECIGVLQGAVEERHEEKIKEEEDDEKGRGEAEEDEEGGEKGERGEKQGGNERYLEEEEGPVEDSQQLQDVEVSTESKEEPQHKESAIVVIDVQEPQSEESLPELRCIEKELPPAFRHATNSLVCTITKFTDEELVFALKNRAQCRGIAETDVYAHNPANLLDMHGTGMHYFFCQTKYCNYTRPTRSRITLEGCRWKQQGPSLPIKINGHLVAFKTYLSFISLRAKSNTKSTSSRGSSSSSSSSSCGLQIVDQRGSKNRRWSRYTMEEIALSNDKQIEQAALKQGYKPRPFHVICRISRKSQPVPEGPVIYDNKLQQQSQPQQHQQQRLDMVTIAHTRSTLALPYASMILGNARNTGEIENAEPLQQRHPLCSYCSCNDKDEVNIRKILQNFTCLTPPSKSM